VRIVLVEFEGGGQMVGFYKGEHEYNGKKYQLVSPYTDSRPPHYLAYDTILTTIKE